VFGCDRCVYPMQVQICIHIRFFRCVHVCCASMI
jgi:hypothetical protein